MSKLAEFRALEAQLATQLKQLDAMKNDDGLKREIEFENKLRQLMAKYGVGLKEVIALLDPQRLARPASTESSSPRRERKVKIYKNPKTGEVVETKGGNHKVLKLWKQEFGADAVESWLQ